MSEAQEVSEASRTREGGADSQVKGKDDDDTSTSDLESSLHTRSNQDADAGDSSDTSVESSAAAIPSAAGDSVGENSETESQKSTDGAADESVAEIKVDNGGGAAADVDKITTTSPLMEDVKQMAADLQRKEDGPQSGAEKDEYHLKWIKFKGRSVPIVTQNINGPCPLIAIVNVLFLKEKITLDPSVEIVTSSQLMGYLGDIVLQATPQNLALGEQANWEQNVNDAIAVFHKLQTGLDVNVRFTGVQDFEYTPECVVFDLLNISLYHGWLVDTALRDTVQAVGNLTYNQLVEMIIENQASSDTSKSTQALLGQLFLDESASQLTYHGLAELSCTLAEDDMAVFFRNNHFSTIYKHRKELFLLVTDQGYLRESQVVWETMSNVEGDGFLVDSCFHTAHRLNRDPVTPPTVPLNVEQQMEQDRLLALSLNQQEAPAANRAFTSESDEQFAKRLQSEEESRAAMQQQPYQQQQPPPQRRQQRQQPQRQQRDEYSRDSTSSRSDRSSTGSKKDSSCVIL